MLTADLQEAMDANADDILDFLEREIRAIQPCKQPSEGMNMMIDVQREHKGNMISVYERTCQAGQNRSGIIRFEVIQYTKTLSIIKAFYEVNDQQFILVFYRIWTKLAIAFGATFAGEAFRALHELEQSIP
jgi:hypothetical protein